MAFSGELSLSIKAYQPKLIAARREEFMCYSFDLISDYKQKQFHWTINKSYDDIKGLISKLSKEQGRENLRLPPLRNYEELTTLLLPDQIQEIYQIISAVLANYSESNVVLEFVEVSTNSFNLDTKYKEGYVTKLGIGRISNQRKWFKCWSKSDDRFHVWLRVRDYGVEFSNSHSIPEILDIIPFNFDFQVTKGRSKTGFPTGIRIATSTHDMVFIAESALQRDDFMYAILNAYSRSEYFQKVSRFESSFLIRPFNTCKAYVDGEEYFSDMYDALVGARSHVYITDWWLSPEVYLKRPSESNPNTRIVDVLGQLADRGIQVYVHLYKQLSFVSGYDSLYTKQTLQQRSNKIHVIRHPSFKNLALLWTHHGKMVLVDGEKGFIGGLDICYGRFDTNNHPLTDTQEPFIWNSLIIIIHG